MHNVWSWVVFINSIDLANKNTPMYFNFSWSWVVFINSIDLVNKNTPMYLTGATKIRQAENL